MQVWVPLMAKEHGDRDFHFPPPPLVVKLIGLPLLVLQEFK